jgi:ferredoxin-NADP reductase
VARAAVRRRLTWQVAEVRAVRGETDTARTLVLDLPDWPGHLAGQHVDVRLTAEDGYSTQRSYSIASAPGGPLELTVQRIADGEVSPYLVDVAQAGDAFEVRGPVGGYFVWSPGDAPGDASGASAGESHGASAGESHGAGSGESHGAAPARVLLAAGGSGIVPLMAMIRTRRAAESPVPFRLVYSVRSPETAIYADELRALAGAGDGLEVTFAYTRRSPDPAGHPAGRIDAAALTEAGWPPSDAPSCFVCGSTGFVETIAGWLVDAGHEPARIKTERFGPTGETQ